MITVNLYDSAFLHLTCSVHGKTARRIKYVRWKTSWTGLTIFTDTFLADGRMLQNPDLGTRIGWLLEPREYAPQNYAGAERNLEHLDLLLTHDQDLLDRYPEKARFVPFGGCWILEENFGMHRKTKQISHIMSSKMALEGHRLRHQVMALHKADVDHFGRGTPRACRLERKEEGLLPYQFSIAIENSCARNFFTEKLLDCFATGTIPIYWGCPNIGDFFDPSGIIEVDDLDHISRVIAAIKDHGQDIATALLPGARRNLDLMRKYEITDDWIAQNVLEGL